MESNLNLSLSSREGDEGDTVQGSVVPVFVPVGVDLVVKLGRCVVHGEGKSLRRIESHKQRYESVGFKVRGREERLDGHAAFL